jgi:DNA mismatch repair protein MutS2
MIYPQNFEQKTGFDQIRNMIHNQCLSSLGQFHTTKMRFIADFATINNQLEQTEEFRQIFFSGDAFPSANYNDPYPVFNRIKTEGTYAEAEELGDLRASIVTISEILSFLAKHKTDDRLKYPVLHKLGEHIYLDKSILEEIDRVIDEKNVIRSNASDTLAQIRRSKVELDSQATRRINQIFGQAKKEGWVSGDSELALRNSRQVIPVPVAYKRKIKGFIHDQSSTGQTVFLEPEEIFEINNEIRQLELDERREIVRILKSLADFIRPYIPSLKEAYTFLGKIDFIRAKAKVAIEMDAMKPHLHNKPVINWIRAKHPLLWLSYKAQKKHVEPLSLNLNDETKIMVISGPNAGGKSVCLKTAGLIQYMIQCGMLVPMEDYSDAGIFQHIFIDIGDEQSLENDLSTYSSHLANMRFFLEKGNNKTLILIDEFGAGTEPRLGGAIAEAILDELSNNNNFGIITTHYANLKLLADKKPGIINGSMLFDTQNMRPLYRLKTGNPGSSFAFEIAKTMGLQESLLAKAEEIAGIQHIDFDRQLQDLDLKKIELEEKEKQLKAGDSFLSEMIEKYQKLNEDLSLQKNQIINQAKQEAKKILTESNRMIEKTIREIKENIANKEKTKQLRNQLAEFSKQQSEDIDDSLEAAVSRKKKKQKNQQKNEIEIETTPILIGDIVRIIGQQSIGDVVEIGDRDAVVAFGSMLLKTPLKKLEKINKKSFREKEKSVKIKYDFDINEKASEFNPQLDIRGNRAEEALVKARRFVDDAILLGVRQLKIVHGTGDGILREALRDYLRTVSEVKRARDEHPDRGGSGCTLIELK